MSKAKMTRQELREHYEQNHAPENWENWGDANPEAHGGVWVSYNPDRGVWSVFETVHAGTYEQLENPENYGKQYVTAAEIHWGDLFDENGELTDGRFGGFKSHIKSYSDRRPKTPDGIVVNGELTQMAAWYGVENADPYGGNVGGYSERGSYDMENYDAVLQSLGIDR